MDASAAAIRDALSIELGAELVTGGRDATTASVVCDSGLVRLTVTPPGNEVARTRTLAPPTNPETGARLVALALFELLSASWTAFAPRTHTHPAVRALLHELDAVAGGRAWWSGPGFVGEGGIRYVGRFGYHLGVDADLLTGGGHVATSIGRVDLASASARVGLLAHREWSKVGVFGSLGLRVGGLHLSGTPKDPTAVRGGSGWGTWLGPSAIIGVEGKPTRRLRLGFIAEVGDAARPVRGLVAGASRVSFSGAWLGAHVTIGVAL